MITEPGLYAEQFVDAGANMVSIHVEIDPHLHRTLTCIRKRGALAGVAINPATPLVALEEALPFADYILIMSVNPGFGGQKFIPTSLDKVRRLRRMIEERGLKTRIEIDGGVDRSNIAEIAAAGAEIIVAGSTAPSNPSTGRTAATRRRRARPPPPTACAGSIRRSAPCSRRSRTCAA